MADNTATLQFYLNSHVSIPNGTYEVDVTKSLRVPSNTTLDLTGVVLQALPTDKEKYALLLIDDVSNVTIKNGEIVGDRKTHKGTTGEWGMGVKVGKADKVSLSNMLVKECWGDGFYVSGATDLTIDSCVADNNRRQGLSVIACKGLKVLNSVFKNTKGTKPSDGIDIEPDKGDVIDGVTISNCQLLNNAGNGIEIAGKRGTVKNVNISNCTYKGNGNLKLKVENVSQVSWLWSLFARVFGTEDIKFA